MNKVILSGFIRNKGVLVQGERQAHIWFDLDVKREYRKKSSDENLQKYDRIKIHLLGNRAIAFEKDKKNGDYLEVIGRLQIDHIKKDDGTTELKCFIVPESIEYGPIID